MKFKKFSIMKAYFIVFFIILNLISGCSKKNFVSETNSQYKSNSINLDAYQSNDVNSKVHSTLKQNTAEIVYLDGMKFNINSFKSIIDTLKGEYMLKRIDSNSLKIVRINKK